MPVYRAARAGPHGAAWEWWLAKRTPVAASRSRWGVSTSGCPAADRQSARSWSRVTKRTFTCPTLPARHSPGPRARPAKTPPGPAGPRCVDSGRGARRRTHRGGGPVGRGGGLPPRAPASRHVLRHPRGTRRHRRHLGPVPLPGRPLRLGHVHPRVLVRAVGGRQGHRRRPVDPRVHPQHGPHARGGGRVRFRRRVVGASWSTPDARWTVEVEDTASGETGPADLRLPVGNAPATTATTRATAPNSRARPTSAAPSSTPSTGQRTSTGGPADRGDRQRGDRRDAGARPGRRWGRPRHDAAAVADVHRVPAGRGQGRRLPAPPPAGDGGPRRRPVEERTADPVQLRPQPTGAGAGEEGDPQGRGGGAAGRLRRRHRLRPPLRPVGPAAVPGPRRRPVRGHQFRTAPTW